MYALTWALSSYVKLGRRIAVVKPIFSVLNKDKNVVLERIRVFPRIIFGINLLKGRSRTILIIYFQDLQNFLVANMKPELEDT